MAGREPSRPVAGAAQLRDRAGRERRAAGDRRACRAARADRAAVHGDVDPAAPQRAVELAARAPQLRHAAVDERRHREPRRARAGRAQAVARPRLGAQNRADGRRAQAAAECDARDRGVRGRDARGARARASARPSRPRCCSSRGGSRRSSTALTPPTATATPPRSAPAAPACRTCRRRSSAARRPSPRRPGSTIWRRARRATRAARRPPAPRLLGTTSAAGRSPHSSSRTAITTTSRTAGCSTIARSSSAELIHSPPDLTRSFSRSTISTAPSRPIRATSPVRNQPSGVKRVALASPSGSK